jgi:hypothetical protein
MPRYKHRRSVKGFIGSRVPYDQPSSVITPEPCNNEFRVDDTSGNVVNRMDVVSEDDVPPAVLVFNDVLFYRSRLYEITKPVVKTMKATINDTIATSVGTSGIPDLNLRWGKERMSNNYYFHYKCLRWTIEYLIGRFGREAIKYLVGYTDGCPDQYKSRRNAVMVARLCDELGLEEYLHHFAPTASFKTNVDAFGGDTKFYVTKQERRELFRCQTAEDVYLQCRDGMPQPRIVNDENRELENCDERIQVYLVDVKYATEAHLNDPNVIITNSVEESWDASELRGIKSIYALRGYRGGTNGKDK